MAFKIVEEDSTTQEPKGFKIVDEEQPQQDQQPHGVTGSFAPVPWYLRAMQAVPQTHGNQLTPEEGAGAASTAARTGLSYVEGVLDPLVQAAQLGADVESKIAPEPIRQGAAKLSQTIASHLPGGRLDLVRRLDERHLLSEATALDRFSSGVAELAGSFVPISRVAKALEFGEKASNITRALRESLVATAATVAQVNAQRPVEHVTPADWAASMAWATGGIGLGGGVGAIVERYGKKLAPELQRMISSGAVGAMFGGGQEATREGIKKEPLDWQQIAEHSAMGALGFQLGSLHEEMFKGILKGRTQSTLQDQVRAAVQSVVDVNENPPKTPLLLEQSPESITRMRESAARALWQNAQATLKAGGRTLSVPELVKLVPGLDPKVAGKIVREGLTNFQRDEIVRTRLKEGMLQAAYEKGGEPLLQEMAYRLKELPKDFAKRYEARRATFSPEEEQFLANAIPTQQEALQKAQATQDEEIRAMEAELRGQKAAEVTTGQFVRGAIRENPPGLEIHNPVGPEVAPRTGPSKTKQEKQARAKARYQQQGLEAIAAGESRHPATTTGPGRPAPAPPAARLPREPRVVPLPGQAEPTNVPTIAAGTPIKEPVGGLGAPPPPIMSPSPTPAPPPQGTAAVEPPRKAASREKVAAAPKPPSAAVPLTPPPVNHPATSTPSPEVRPVADITHELGQKNVPPERRTQLQQELRAATEQMAGIPLRDAQNKPVSTASKPRLRARAPKVENPALQARLNKATSEVNSILEQDQAKVQRAAKKSGGDVTFSSGPLPKELWDAVEDVVKSGYRRARKRPIHQVPANQIGNPRARERDIEAMWQAMSPTGYTVRGAALVPEFQPSEAMVKNLGPLQAGEKPPGEAEGENLAVAKELGLAVGHQIALRGPGGQYLASTGENILNNTAQHGQEVARGYHEIVRNKLGYKNGQMTPDERDQAYKVYNALVRGQVPPRVESDKAAFIATAEAEASLGKKFQVPASLRSKLDAYNDYMANFIAQAKALALRYDPAFVARQNYRRPTIVRQEGFPPHTRFLFNREWSQQYNAKYDQAMTIQDEIATDVERLSGGKKKKADTLKFLKDMYDFQDHRAWGKYLADTSKGLQTTLSNYLDRHLYLETHVHREIDPEIWLNKIYAPSVLGRVYQAAEWGSDLEFARRALDMIGHDYGARTREDVAQLADKMLGNAPGEKPAPEYMQQAQALARFRHLGIPSGVSNLLPAAMGTFWNGNRNTWLGMLEAWKADMYEHAPKKLQQKLGSQAAFHFVNRTGAVMRSELAMAQQDLQGLLPRAADVSMNYLNFISPIDRWTRQAVAAGGQLTAEAEIKNYIMGARRGTKQSKDALDWLRAAATAGGEPQLVRMLQNPTKLTPGQIDALTQRLGLLITNQVNARADPKDLPPWASHPKLKFVMDMRKFMYRASAANYNYWNALKGNPALQRRFIAGLPAGLAAGYGVQRLIRAMNDQDRRDPWYVKVGDLLNTYAIAGAVLEANNIFSQRYGSYAEELVGPTVGEAALPGIEGLRIIKSLLTGNYNPSVGDLMYSYMYHHLPIPYRQALPEPKRVEPHRHGAGVKSGV